MVVIPAELLCKRAWETMWCINGLRIRIVVAKHGKDWAPYILLEKTIHANLSILSECARELVLRVVGDKISGVDCPCNGRIAMCPCQGCDGLKSRQTKVVRRVTFE